jgi:hypothetical protein
MSSRSSLFTGGVFLAGGILGSVVGFKLAERRLMREFDEAVAEVTAKERSAARRMYAAKQPFPSPEEAVERLVPAEVEEILDDYRSQEPREQVAYHKIKTSQIEVEKAAAVEKPPPVVEENIFAINEEPGEIVVISQAEYENEESGYMQGTMTFYAEDRVLADADDERIEDVLGTVGELALDRFGHLTEHANHVYVRNNHLRLEFEIVRDSGSYWRSVHQMEPVTDRPSQGG